MVNIELTARFTCIYVSLCFQIDMRWDVVLDAEPASDKEEEEEEDIQVFFLHMLNRHLWKCHLYVCIYL